MTSPYYRVDHEAYVAVQNPFHISIANVNVSRMNSVNKPTNLIKSSKGEHAIPVSNDIRLRTSAYYRGLEESDSGGIGDKEEATFYRDTDFATFQRDSGQSPLQAAHHVHVNLTHRRECWLFCTSSAPVFFTETKKMRESIDPDYDAVTLIEDPSSFAMQLGIDFGGSFETSAVTHPGPAHWKLPGLVIVEHGPVVYAESPSERISRFLPEYRGLVTPFFKRKRFSVEKEYRFVISIGGQAEPKETSFDLNVTKELKDLTRLIE